jgi:hypothetical protein
MGNIIIRVRHMSLLYAVCNLTAPNVGRLYHKQTENRRLRLFLRENGPTNYEPRARVYNGSGEIGCYGDRQQ